MRKKWRYLIGCLFLGFVALAAMMHKQLQQYAINYAVEQIESRAGCRLEIREMQLSFPFNLHINRLQATAQGKPILHIEGLTVVVNPWELLRKRIAFEKIHIHKLESPIKAPASNSSNSPRFAVAESFSWEMIPFSFTIGSLHIDEFQSEFEVPLCITGHGAVDPAAQESSIDLTITPTAEPNAKTHLTAFIEQRSDLVETQLRITESDNGVLARRVNLPKGRSFQSVVQASGAQNTWRQLLDGIRPETIGLINGDLQFSFSSEQSDNTEENSYGFFASPFVLSTNYDIRFLNLEGAFGPCQLQGECHLTADGALDGTKLKIQVAASENIERWFEGEIGELEVACALKGNLTEPHATLQVQCNGLNVKKFKLEQIMLQSELQYLSGILQGAVDASFAYNHETIHALSAISWNGGPDVQLSNVRIASKDIQLQGDLALAASTLVGELTGKLPLAQLDPKMQGECAFKARLFTLKDVQALEISLEGNNIHINDAGAEKASLTATLIAPYEKPTGDLKFSCENASLGDYRLAHLECDTSMDPNATQWPFTCSLQSDQLKLQTMGFWHQSVQGMRLVMDTFSGTAEGHPFFLQDPVTLHVGDAIDLSPVHLTVAQGALTAIATPGQNGALNGVTLHAQSIPLELVRLIRPNFSIKGFLNADILLAHSEKKIMSDMQIELRDVNIAELEEKTLLPLNAKFTAGLHDDLLKCTGQINGLGPTPIEIAADLPVCVTLHPLALKLDPNAPLSIHFVQRGQIESLLELIMTAPTTLLTGETAISIDVAGTINAPNITGLLTIENGSFEILDVGLALKGVKGQMQLQEGNKVWVELDSIGTDSSGVKCRGNIELDLKKECPFELTVVLDRVGFTPLQYASILAGGRLTVKGDLQHALLQGKILTDAFDITIPDEIPALTHTVEVLYINQPSNAIRPTLIADSTSTWPIALDLDIEIPRKGMITGKDWNSEWQGRVAITGSAEAPLLHGSCKIMQGEYRFNGKGFKITEGNISFAGEPDKKTSLYVIASRDLGDIIAEIIVKGPIKNPAISFRSNPPLSQREIVSWILFNRGTSEITPFQGTQLNDSITNLSSSQQPDMLTKIRNRMGIDRIDISRGENGTSNEVSVQVGKYISHGIFVSINKSVSSEANRVAIEANLIRNVKVQAEVGDDSTGQLLLKWKHDY